MLEFASDMTFRQPPEEVFDYIADCRNEPSWHPDAISVEKTSDGPVALGTRFVSRYRKIGSQDYEIVEYERPSRLAVDYEAKGAHFHGGYTLSPSGGGTAVSVRGGGQLKGLWRLFTPLARASMKREQARWGEWLQRGLDSRSG